MNKQMVVERRMGKKVSVDGIKGKVQKCLDTAFGSGRGRGWTVKSINVLCPKTKAKGAVYNITIDLATTTSRASVENKWEAIVKRFAQAGCAGMLRRAPFVVVKPDGYTHIATKAKAKEELAVINKRKQEEGKTLGEVNLEPNGCFDRLYGREPQTNRILDALRLGKRTNWSKRTHTILDGPPGSGKTEAMLAFTRMLGEENKAWQWFDATSMTKAGVLEQLIESPVVPPVLFIEEIEKCDESSLRWLLGVMDARGEIRRTNYRVGNQARNVRMIVIASANDVKLLRGLMSGALYSRFQNKIYCPHPNREVMRQILVRECKEIKGKIGWIEPTLEFAYDKWGMRDPRDLITIMSCGGNRLLTGEYQKDYEKTMHPSERRLLERKVAARKRKREAKTKK